MIFLFLSLSVSLNPFAQAQKVPQRVIVLSPALVEIIYALGLEDKIVGASEFADYPEAAKKIPVVGPYTKPSLEKVLELKPDLILIAIEGPVDVAKRFEQLHLKYEVISMKSLDEIGAAAKKVATLLGDEKKGIEFEKDWKKKVTAAFQTKKTFKQVPRALIEVEQEPLIVAAQGTFLHEILQKCGGENIFGDLQGYPRLSYEELFGKKMDLILMADYFPNERTKKRALKNWKEFLLTKNTRTVVLDPAITSRPGPRLLLGIKALCGTL